MKHQHQQIQHYGTIMVVWFFWLHYNPPHPPKLVLVTNPIKLKL